MFNAFNTPFQMPDMNAGTDTDQQSAPGFPFPMQGFSPWQINVWMLPFSQMMQMMQMLQMMQQWMFSMGMNAMNAANARQKDASIPGLNLPGLDLQKLLQMEASPKALEGLQKVLDMVFDAYTGQKQA